MTQIITIVSVLALSSRFDGLLLRQQGRIAISVSVLALSSRFDGLPQPFFPSQPSQCFSTRSVESF